MRTIGNKNICENGTYNLTADILHALSNAKSNLERKCLTVYRGKQKTLIKGAVKSVDAQKHKFCVTLFSIQHSVCFQQRSPHSI